MIKSGLDHIASLRDGRAVYLHGKRVDDVTRHPAYANAVKSIGRLFDFPSRHQELMTFVADSGERANRIWQLPESYQELCDRRKALEAWNGLLEGALAVHDRFLVLEVLSRLDWGDAGFAWRIRRRQH